MHGGSKDKFYGQQYRDNMKKKFQKNWDYFDRGSVYSIT